MRRKIITIDEDKCNGCGNCVTACAEGALAIVDGKARLVREQFCDGFGDCIGECPTGALRIEERDAEEFDQARTKEHLWQLGGEEAVRRMEEAARRHAHHAAEPAEATEQERVSRPGVAGGPMAAYGGCPGTRVQFRPRNESGTSKAPTGSALAGVGHVIASELEQWPVQIHLVSPGAPFFRNRELVVLSTCAPVASADIHWRFIRGRAVAVGCPKLDDTRGYTEKLAAILRDPTIPRVIVVRMEVPCCGGLTRIVEEAVRLSGREDLRAEEVTLAVNGDYIGSRSLRDVGGQATQTWRRNSK